MRKSLLAGCIICLLSSQYLFAQEEKLINVSQNKLSYRPVVKNNRILWFDMPETNKGTGRVSLHLFEDGQDKEITNAATVLFTGWPDLDEWGDITYTRNVGTSHQVFLYDGIKEIQITNNEPAVKKSTIDMGLGSDRVRCGFPRIHNGDIVFKDKKGHIYLYQKNRKAIKKITTLPSQTANLGEGDNEPAAPGNAHVKYFEFDGNHIVWMHEDIAGNNNSKISIYMANAADSFKVKLITSFDAWVPNNKATLPGKLWNPFFKACNGYIIWQYYLPSRGPNVPPAANLPKVIKDYGANIDDVHVGFYDGTDTAEISKGTYVALQSVRVTDGKAIWWQIRKEGKGKNVKKFNEVVLYEKGGKPVAIASYAEPPKQANTQEKFWDGILDAEIMGADVFWVMGQTECFQQFKMPVTNEPYCMYKPTKNIGFFRSSSGTRDPFRHTDSETFSGGGEYDRGLYAFFSDRSSPLVRDISAMRILGGPDTSKSMVTVIDRQDPDMIKWKTDEKGRKKVTDAFSISYDFITGCGESQGTKEVILESITLDVTAEKQPLVRLEDIQSIALYRDVNENQKFDSLTDKLLGWRNATVPANVIFTFSDGIKIEKGKLKYFFVEMEIKEDVCPCSKYKVTVEGEKLSFKKAGAGVITASGRSTGGIALPIAEIKEALGDEQAGLPGQKLPEKLVVIYKDFPIRCGKAAFKITQQPPEKGAIIISSKGETTDAVLLNFTQVGKDAMAEINFQLGKNAGLYNITASMVMPDGIVCDNQYKIFREHAGKMTVHIIDLNNPDYFTATPDNSNPDFSSWSATMSSDIEKLSFGGQGRVGALADGASMLLIRLKLPGFTEPPPGEINLTINGNDKIGHLSKGLGESIPSYDGGNAAALKWTKTKTGVYAFALYTPPLNFGDKAGGDRNVHIKAVYSMPGVPEPLIKEDDIALIRPPVAFVHGVWSDAQTWGYHFTKQRVEFNIHLLDYAELSDLSFDQLSFVVKDGISDIIKKLRSEKIAATRINVVGHSMGGLVTRQFFADNNGLSYHRQDNFGKGDIYKFITIGTPHYGSPVAWMGMTMRKSLFNPFLDKMKLIGKDIDAGAIEAMCPGSKQLTGLGNTHIPSHTVRAWNLDTKEQNLSWYQLFMYMKKQIIEIFSDNPDVVFLKNLNWNVWIYMIKYYADYIKDIGMTSLYSSDKTDMLVTSYSQAGGIAQGGNKVFDNTIHFALPDKTSYVSSIQSETTSEAIADYIFSVLNKDLDNIEWFAPMLPKPTVQDPGKTCK